MVSLLNGLFSATLYRWYEGVVCVLCLVGLGILFLVCCQVLKVSNVR